MFKELYRKSQMIEKSDILRVNEKERLTVIVRDGGSRVYSVCKPGYEEQGACSISSIRYQLMNGSSLVSAKMDINFKGKRALVTGAGKGIGRCVAKMLSRCGAEVIALSRTQADLDSLKAEVPAIQTACVDIGDTEAAVKAVSEMGDIQLLVNNAGVSNSDRFLDVKPGDFDRLFSVNVKAALFIGQAVAKNMAAKGNGGAIVNISSQASKVALKNHTLYCTAKASLDMLTKMMALELGPHKIRVNAVNPTVVMTQMGRTAWSDPAKSGPLLNRIPLGRFAEEEEVGQAVLYLLSDKASMVHGATLPVDGGFWAC